MSNTVQAIDACIAALDKVSVSGASNLDKVLGVIQTLSRVSHELREQEGADGK